MYLYRLLGRPWARGADGFRRTHPARPGGQPGFHSGRAGWSGGSSVRLVSPGPAVWPPCHWRPWNPHAPCASGAGRRALPEGLLPAGPGWHGTTRGFRRLSIRGPLAAADPQRRTAGHGSHAKLGSSRGFAATLSTNPCHKPQHPFLSCNSWLPRHDTRGRRMSEFCCHAHTVLWPAPADHRPPRLTSSHHALRNICTSYTRTTPPNHYTPHTTHRYALKATHQTPSPPTPNDATARAGLIRGRVATRS